MLTSNEGFVKGFCECFQNFTALMEDGKLEFIVLLAAELPYLLPGRS